MEQSREDRMRSRMRGAARHQVQDTDFGDLFAAIPAAVTEPDPSSSDGPATASPNPTPPPPPPATTTRTNPNTSAKRRRLNSGDNAASQSTLPTQQQASPSSAAPFLSSANRSTRRRPLQPVPAISDPYDLGNVQSTADEAEIATVKPPSSSSRSRASSRRSQEPKEKSVALRSSPRNQTQQVQSSPIPALRVEEEVGESPVDAPGSGHRRRVRVSGAVDSSAMLHSALRSLDNDTAHNFPQSSSPLSRKSRKSAAGSALAVSTTRTTGLRRSTRLSGSPDDESNELSLESPENVKPDDSEAVVLEVAETVIEEPAIEVEEDAEEAEEIDVREAARRLARKRPRRSAVAASPEAASDDMDEEHVFKRPRKARASKKKSPAKQRQPEAPRAKQSKTAQPRKKNSGEENPRLVPIKVQRFTRSHARASDDEDEEDILNADIPFANRSGVNSVDVLAQVCNEIIDHSKNIVKESALNAPTGAAKKEARTKFAALEAFQEQLRTRLLEHTIALDTLYALKRRVREAQRAKVKLRERIMEIRAEREQIALRMDAVRIKHDADSKGALHNINLSAAMHDIDLAIEEGRAAPELSAKEQQTADLANLELLISRVAEQACSSGPDGGTLRQIKNFNAFLERAVAAL